MLAFFGFEKYSKSGIAASIGSPRIVVISSLYLILTSRKSRTNEIISEIIRPAANAIRTFFITLGDVGSFGTVASSTILSFALSLTFAIVSGAVLAMASPIFFASYGLEDVTIA